MKLLLYHDVINLIAEKAEKLTVKHPIVIKINIPLQNTRIILSIVR